MYLRPYLKKKKRNGKKYPDFPPCIYHLLPLCPAKPDAPPFCVSRHTTGLDSGSRLSPSFISLSRSLSPCISIYIYIYKTNLTPLTIHDHQPYPLPFQGIHEFVLTSRSWWSNRFAAKVARLFNTLFEVNCQNVDSCSVPNAALFLGNNFKLLIVAKNDFQQYIICLCLNLFAHNHAFRDN